MKLAVLSDVHANWVALQAVAAHLAAWGPDQVVVAGDLVNRGSRPLECLRWVQEQQRLHGWLVTRGNHEDYVIAEARPHAAAEGPVFRTNLPSHWTLRRLNGNAAALEALPFQASLSAPDGKEVRITHASMLSLRQGIYPETGDAELAELIAPPPAVLCVGHTHRPLIRQLNGTLVVNAGSAGLPFDGDTRPSYARLEWQGGWKAEIVRVPYDLAAAERDLVESGYLEEAGPLVELVQLEMRQACSHLGQWSDRYQKACLSGEIGVRASVDAYLREIAG